MRKESSGIAGGAAAGGGVEERTSSGGLPSIKGAASFCELLSLGGMGVSAGKGERAGCTQPLKKLATPIKRTWTNKTRFMFMILLR